MNQALMMKLQKMQKEMENKQIELENKEFVSSTGGICTIKVNGKKELLSVKLNKDCFESSDDLDMIEDAIVSCFNDCIRQIDDEEEELMAPYKAFTQGGFR